MSDEADRSGLCYLAALLADSAVEDRVKEGALILLADLRLPLPERVVLAGPDIILARSVRQLLDGLDTPNGMAEAVASIRDLVPEGERAEFICTVEAEHAAAGERLRALADALGAGEDASAPEESVK